MEDMTLFRVQRDNGYVLWRGYSHDAAVKKCLELQAAGWPCSVVGNAELGVR